MAILISNQRARSKGAMTLKPFANSTFTESLFFLEDTMKKMIESKKQLITAHNYRREAREKMKKLFPNLDWHINCVHHFDGNPFNNNLSNLRIVLKQKHKAIHQIIKVNQIERRTK